MNTRPLRRVIYSDPGYPVYVSGYEGNLFTKARAQKYVTWFNRGSGDAKIMFIKSSDRFAAVWDGVGSYFKKGKEYLTVDGVKTLYELDPGWDIVKAPRHISQNPKKENRKPKGKIPSPFGL